jgi:hypothetical protein
MVFGISGEGNMETASPVWKRLVDTLFLREECCYNIKN